MLFEIMQYPSFHVFNREAARRNHEFEQNFPDLPADRYWQVAGFKVRDDGLVTVLWCRRTKVNVADLT